jgi:hypothetical protein
LINLPITITDKNGDHEVFDSVEAAEAYMEPIDVRSGEYMVRSADGRELKLRVIVSTGTMLWGFWKIAIEKVEIFE